MLEIGSFNSQQAQVVKFQIQDMLSQGRQNIEKMRQNSLLLVKDSQTDAKSRIGSIFNKSPQLYRGRMSAASMSNRLSNSNLKLNKSSLREELKESFPL